MLVVCLRGHMSPCATFFVFADWNTKSSYQNGYCVWNVGWLRLTGATEVPQNPCNSFAWYKPKYWPGYRSRYRDCVTDWTTEELWPNSQQWNRFLCSPKRPDRLSVTPSLQFDWFTREFFAAPQSLITFPHLTSWRVCTLSELTFNIVPLLVQSWMALDDKLLCINWLGYCKSWSSLLFFILIFNFILIFFYFNYFNIYNFRCFRHFHGGGGGSSSSSSRRRSSCLLLCYFRSSILWHNSNFQNINILIYFDIFYNSSGTLTHFLSLIQAPCSVSHRPVLSSDSKSSTSYTKPTYMCTLWVPYCCRYGACLHTVQSVRTF